MSRLEVDFTAAGEASLSNEEAANLASDRQLDSRHRAIARGLAAGEGWQEALRELRGAFASGGRKGTRLSDRQAE